MLEDFKRQLYVTDKLRCRNADQSLITPFVALYVTGTYSDRLQKCCQNSKLPALFPRNSRLSQTHVHFLVS
jgi:hypothetical protein